MAGRVLQLDAEEGATFLFSRTLSYKSGEWSVARPAFISQGRGEESSGEAGTSRNPVSMHYNTQLVMGDSRQGS